MSARKMNRTLILGLCVAWLCASVAPTMAQQQGKPDRANEKEKRMVRAEVGEPAPDFTLTDIQGKKHTLSEYTKEGKTVVLEWFNPDCPYVKKHHEAHHTMANLYEKFKDKDVVWFAINSGSKGNATSGVKRNEKAVKEFKIEYPILLDESGKVGRTYKATNTPHMYVISSEGTLMYAGAIDSDNSPFRLGEVNYVEQALEKTLAGETVEHAKTRAYGCAVKYSRR